MAPNPSPTPDPKPHLPARAGEKDALRIQAAAVAAQQAALTEEEGRLEKRRSHLEQQEAQLAAHLKDKHQRLVEVRDQARQAREVLREERAAYEQRILEMTGQLADARAEVTDGQEKVLAERRRLLDLRRRMKHRWHRHWAAERATIRRRNNLLDAQARELEKEKERLEQEKAQQIQARLRLNGEMELGRRQVQAEWTKLRQEQRLWQERRDREEADMKERTRNLLRRESPLAQVAQNLAEEKREWETRVLLLRQEAEGLENRVRNQRQKMLEQEQDITRMQASLKDLQEKTDPTKETPLFLPVPKTGSLVPAIASTAPAHEPESREIQFIQLENEQLEQMAELEKLACDLADQRRHLKEQCDRLAQVQARWQADREEAAVELEALARHLAERDRALATQKQELEAAASGSRQQQDQLLQRQRALESWQARLTARSTAWEAERDLLLADLKTREELADQRQTALLNLRQRWQQRRRQEMERLRSAFAICARLRQSAVALRQDCLRRNQALNQVRRTLTERALAIKQYQQECTRKTLDPATAKKHLERLRRRWAALSAAAEKTLQQERQTLEQEALQLEERYAQMHKWAEHLVHQELELSTREMDTEKALDLARDEIVNLRQQILGLQRHREVIEHQTEELNQQVEVLACSLIESAEGNAVPRQVERAA